MMVGAALSRDFAHPSRSHQRQRTIYPLQTGRDRVDFLFVQRDFAHTLRQTTCDSPASPMYPYLRHARILVALLPAIALTSTAGAQTPTKDSPFLPPATAAAATNGTTSYEFAGMSVAGKATLLSIVRTRDKRSFWVPVGQTVGEITAVSYDPKTDQATIKADGQLLTLSMRKSVVVNAPVSRQPAPNPVAVARPATLPAVSIPPPPATEQEEKETEARMLVTDLLEIGQEQRRAYEEAQRQAAEKAKSANGKAAGANR